MHFLDRVTLEQVPIVALTATATPAVCQDVAAALQLHQPVIYRSTFNRWVG